MTDLWPPAQRPAARRGLLLVLAAAAAIPACAGEASESTDVALAKAYDCRRPWWLPVSALFGKDWPTEQKKWCCDHKHVACEVLHAKKKPVVFDCEKDLIQWDVKWTGEQKEWCCTHMNRGCLAPEWSSEPYHCQEGLAEWKTKWSKGKKTWCCHFDNLGCEEAPAPSGAVKRSSRQHQDARAEVHDCHSSAEHLWPPSKKSWCCRHFHLGCPAPAVDDHGSAGPTTVATTSTVLPAAAEPSRSSGGARTSHDCSDDPGRWSSEKQAWCCEHESRGCTTCDTLCFVKDVAASCRSRISWLKEHQGHDGTNSSCTGAHRDVLRECGVCSRCDLDDACPADQSEAAMGYHCEPGVDNEVVSWPRAKQRWCCRNSGTGCPSTKTTTTTMTEVFDCKEGAQHWRTSWSHSKRTWCCQTDGVGCTACDSGCALQGFSASCRERIDWLRSHDFADLDNSCSSAVTVVLDQCKSCEQCSAEDACPSSSSQPLHDCFEDLETWKEAWTKDKQRWCCESAAKGCPGQERSRSDADAQSQKNSSDEPPQWHDCAIDFAGLPSTWDADKRSWCCEKQKVGCRGDRTRNETERRGTYDCSHGDSEFWSDDHKKWCCLQEGRGCSLAGIDDLFDCTLGREVASEAWTIAQQKWCCDHHEVGCSFEADLVEKTSTEVVAERPSSSPSPASSSMTTTGGVFFHCFDRIDEEHTWPVAKKQWCCRRHGRGCDDAHGSAGGDLKSACFQRDVAYLPLDMIGAYISYVDSPESCQAQCQRTYQCTQFTFFADEGICHVSDKWSHQQPGSFGTVSGPANCTLASSHDSPWVVMDSLPDVEGETFNDVGNLQSLDEMKQWCEGRVDCVGFAYQAASGRWYPAKRGTGFNPRTAVWSDGLGEPWQWYYLHERVKALSDVGEVVQEFQHRRHRGAQRTAPKATATAARQIMSVFALVAVSFSAAGCAISRMGREQPQPGYSVIHADLLLPVSE